MICPCLTRSRGCAGCIWLNREAESKAHGKPVEAVHFHEVGMMDAVADIVGVCLLMEELAPQRVIVSPIHVGSGQVKCSWHITGTRTCDGIPVEGCANLRRQD